MLSIQNTLSLSLNTIEVENRKKPISITINNNNNMLINSCHWISSERIHSLNHTISRYFDQNNTIFPQTYALSFVYAKNQQEKQKYLQQTR